MKFNDQVVFVRAKLNLSQNELAKELKVSFATISRWENNKTNPTKKELIVFKEFCKDNKIVFEEKNNG